MVPGQTPASNIKLLLMSKMTYMYIMCFPSLLPVKKISKLCQYTDDTRDKF